jgi:hypothetical protein
MKFALTLLLAVAPVLAQDAAPAKCEGLPPGKHANLERMTAAMKLTCEQQLKIEPLLHDEESVSKPLLAFTSFSPEERSEFMNTIKIVARRQIKGQLTPEQQKWMDGDIESVKSGGGGGGKKGGGKAAPPKEAVTAANALDDEEKLSKATMAYSALNPDEKRVLVLQVKKAARKDSNLPLTPEQQKKLDSEIQELSKGGK